MNNHHNKEEELRRKIEEQLRRQRDEEIRRIEQERARQESFNEQLRKGRGTDERPDEDD